MFIKKFSIIFLIFSLVYVLQEAFITQVRLSGGGFSLFLIFTLLWAALSTPEIGALTGFGAGILMDISQSTDGAMGQWTFVMIFAGFCVAYLGVGDENFRASPISLIFIVAAGVVLARLAHAVLGILLGSDVGSLMQVLISFAGSAIWSVVVVPLIMPVVTRLHANIFETRSRL
jgi:rod shape-determining protein MreD